MSSDFEAFKKQLSKERRRDHREAQRRANADLLEEMDDPDGYAHASPGGAGLVRTLWNVATGWLVRIAWTLGLSAWAWRGILSEAGPREPALKFLAAAVVWIPIAAGVTVTWSLLTAKARGFLRVATVLLLPVGVAWWVWSLLR